MVSFILLFLLTGCWSSLEIDDSLLVYGTGIDKKEDKYRIIVEVLKTGGGDGSSTGGDGGQGQSLILERSAESLLDGIRNFIRGAKRRLIFTHNRVCVLSEQVAKDNAIQPIDSLSRDQMLRLRTFMFVSDVEPRKVFEAPPMFRSLQSLELASGMDSVAYVSNFPRVTVMDLFRMISGPVKTAYIPIISIKEDKQQDRSIISGTAVLKGERMVGKLDPRESMGLIFVHGEVQGASVTVEMDGKKKRVSVEVTKAGVDISPHLEGDQLTADVKIEIKGTLAEVPSRVDVNQKWIDRVEEEVSQSIKRDIDSLFNKLQKEYQTDVAGIGLLTYRKYPKEWERLAPQWHDIFAQADIRTQVKTEVYHQGLINQNYGGIYRKPQNNPYRRGQ